MISKLHCVKVQIQNLNFIAKSIYVYLSKYTQRKQKQKKKENKSPVLKFVVNCLFIYK